MDTYHIPGVLFYVSYKAWWIRSHFKVFNFLINWQRGDENVPLYIPMYFRYNTPKRAPFTWN